ncbi:heme exporter protein CcmD [Microbulbifer halophilus]|uniref:Heme exporter protein D n=1 Tax=Microbulbifer halophilus TaxID=453963 RepID=A0ABW5E9Y4_9GAMM|nr:heme exporter protein CcmD [Microbulbifer halophilus]MCW8127522.1 heme exporter protein CcmD [Microbulbifer halophilus]
MEFQFAGLADFLAMNGHGPYVWIAYGVTLLALAGLVIQPVLRRRRLQAALKRQQRIQQRRRSAEKRKRVAEPA